MAAYVASPSLQIEHDIGDALPRSVIGVLPAAAGAMHRQARRVEQILRPRAGPGGVERRVLQQPHQLSRCALADRRDPGFHFRHGFLVGHQLVADPPLDAAGFDAYLSVCRWGHRA